MDKSALDCIRFKDARSMSEVKSESARLVVLTPPYMKHHGEQNKARELAFLKELVAECARVVAPNGVVATMNTDFKDQGMVYLRHIAIAEAAKSAGLMPHDEKIWVRGFKRNRFRKKFSFVLIWSKNKKVLNHNTPEYEPDNWVFTKNQQIAGFRDAISPEIPHILIENYTNPGDLVVSACAGSGTVVIEALALDRRTIGYEINRKMRDIISSREATIDKYYSANFPIWDEYLAGEFYKWLICNGPGTGEEEYVIAYERVDEEDWIAQEKGNCCLPNEAIWTEHILGNGDFHAIQVAARQIKKREKEFPPEKGKFLIPLFLKRLSDMKTIREYPKPVYLDRRETLLFSEVQSLVV
ncbi:MAG: DNA methyltransferase [bacterium]|nr:DNA methyltransferase [bacterium]